ncbi:hypothetical protein ACHAXT_011303 [Thalassiosira profunda]
MKLSSLVAALPLIPTASSSDIVVSWDSQSGGDLKNAGTGSFGYSVFENQLNSDGYTVLDGLTSLDGALGGVNVFYHGTGGSNIGASAAEQAAAKAANEAGTCFIIECNTDSSSQSSANALIDALGALGPVLGPATAGSQTANAGTFIADGLSTVGPYGNLNGLTFGSTLLAEVVVTPNSATIIGTNQLNAWAEWKPFYNPNNLKAYMNFIHNCAGITTDSPTKNPTASPTKNPTESPTKNPTKSPTESPTVSWCPGDIDADFCLPYDECVQCTATDDEGGEIPGCVYHHEVGGGKCSLQCISCGSTCGLLNAEDKNQNNGKPKPVPGCASQTCVNQGVAPVPYRRDPVANTRSSASSAPDPTGRSLQQGTHGRGAVRSTSRSRALDLVPRPSEPMPEPTDATPVEDRLIEDGRSTRTAHPAPTSPPGHSMSLPVAANGLPLPAIGTLPGFRIPACLRPHRLCSDDE